MRLVTSEQIILFNQWVCHAYGNPHVVLNKSLVESAIGSVCLRLEGMGYVHGNLQEIAAALCFKLIKNHPFVDGNKRTAAISSLLYSR